MHASGRAIGVLGTGIDFCCLKENKKLYEKVLERGAIISEFPQRTHPALENFPVRNCIVAGMPRGVVVVEGAQYRGSLITARLAMEFGREVFGVPGNATQPVSFAPNQLIKPGAKLVTLCRRRHRRASQASSGRPGAGRETVSRAAESIGGCGAERLGEETLRTAQY